MDVPVRPTPVQALAAAAAVLVADHDTVGTLTRLCIDCAEAVDAQAAGLMIPDGDGPLEVMTSSSHDAAELDLYELQAGEGPCLDAYAVGAPVAAGSQAELLRRWPTFGAALVEAGLSAVHASPLRWHGRLVGALNVFWTAPRSLDRQGEQLLQAFADVATVVVVQSAATLDVDVPRATRLALARRTVIEQAKGVLAALEGLAMTEAFEVLQQRARAGGASLEDTAQRVVEDAVRPRA